MFQVALDGFHVRRAEVRYSALGPLLVNEIPMTSRTFRCAKPCSSSGAGNNAPCSKSGAGRPIRLFPAGLVFLVPHLCSLLFEVLCHSFARLLKRGPIILLKRLITLV